MRLLSTCLLVGALVAGCASDGPAAAPPDTAADTRAADTVTAADTVPPAAAADSDPDVPDVPARTNAFVVDPAPSTARLDLVVAFSDTDPTRVDVQVVAHAVGPVFGLSYHLVYDPAVLTLDGDLSQPRFLGADAEAIHVVVAHAGDLALGGARRAAALGDVTLADGLVLATVHFRTAPDTRSRLQLSRAYGRDANAALVVLHAATGTLTTAPRAPEHAP